MLTLVQIRAANSSTSSVDTASLVAAYLEFDRQRTSRRQYTKAFGGIAILVLLGAAFGRVPTDEAWLVAGLLAPVPLFFAVIEAIHWHRLVRRLDKVRAEVLLPRKS
jgi:hypothetical protein